MTTEFVSVPASWTVKQVLDHIQTIGNETAQIYAVYGRQHRETLRLLSNDPSGDFRPVLLQSARSHEKADMASGHGLLPNAVSRCANIIFGGENLLRRGDVVVGASKEIEWASNVAEIEHMV